MDQPPVRVSASGEKEKRTTTEAVVTKDPTGRIELPYREVDQMEGIVLGFRQSMITLAGPNGDKGGVSSGAGCGTDFVIVQWGDREAFVRGLDLLVAWVRTFDPKTADELMEADPYIK